MECPAVTVADEQSTHGNPEVTFVAVIKGMAAAPSAAPAELG
jgi:hypothetical protein